MFDTPTSRHRTSLLATILLALGFVLAHAVPSSGAGHPRHHRVRAGETLWSIATAGYPDSDPRAAIYNIEQANHLAGPTIVPGQMLRLP